MPGKPATTDAAASSPRRAAPTPLRAYLQLMPGAEGHGAAVASNVLHWAVLSIIQLDEGAIGGVVPASQEEMVEGRLGCPLSYSWMRDGSIGGGAVPAKDRRRSAGSYGVQGAAWPFQSWTESTHAHCHKAPPTSSTAPSHHKEPYPLEPCRESMASTLSPSPGAMAARAAMPLGWIMRAAPRGRSVARSNTATRRLGLNGGWAKRQVRGRGAAGGSSGSSRWRRPSPGS